MLLSISLKNVAPLVFLQLSMIYYQTLSLGLDYAAQSSLFTLYGLSLTHFDLVCCVA